MSPRELHRTYVPPCQSHLSILHKIQAGKVSGACTFHSDSGNERERERTLFVSSLQSLEEFWVWYQSLVLNPRGEPSVNP